MTYVRVAKRRIGHAVASFGLFVVLISLVMQGAVATRTIAFGTSEVASYSNQYRINEGIPALTINQKLMNSAQAKATHMANNLYFAHDAPDGTTPWSFIANAGYSYISAGENLALTNQSASSVAQGWYNSPGHKANMMSITYTEVGYGIAFVPSFTYNGTTYSNVYLVAAHYGQPTTSTPPPAPAPSAPTPPPTATSNALPSVEPDPIEESPQTADTEPTIPTEESSIPVAEKTDDKDHLPINSSSTENTSSSGTLAVADDDEPFMLSSNIAYAGLSLGIVLVIFGSVAEIWRIINHRPLIPHL